MPGVITDAELLLDQMRNPLAGPQRRLITELLRPLPQSRHQPLALLLIQESLATRSACRPQGFLTLLADHVGPSAYRLAAYLHPARYFALVESLPQQFQSFKTPLLQRSEIPSHSSRITHAEKTESKL
jgi:hypothetical protein